MHPCSRRSEQQACPASCWSMPKTPGARRQFHSINSRHDSIPSNTKNDARPSAFLQDLASTLTNTPRASVIVGCASARNKACSSCAATRAWIACLEMQAGGAQMRNHLAWVGRKQQAQRCVPRCSWAASCRGRQIVAFLSPNGRCGHRKMKYYIYRCTQNRTHKCFWLFFWILIDHFWSSGAESRGDIKLAAVNTSLWQCILAPAVSSRLAQHPAGLCQKHLGPGANSIP